MTDYKRVRAINIVINDSRWYRARIADFWTFAHQKVRVYKPYIFFLEWCTEQLQYLSSEQLIVSIHYQEHFLRFAELQSCPSQVVHSPHLLLVSFDVVPLFRNLGLTFEELLNEVSCFISGGIIEDNDVEVGVVLHNYWLHVFKVSFTFSIVIGWYYNAEGCLLSLTYIVFHLIVLYFLIANFANRIQILLN